MERSTIVIPEYNMDTQTRDKTANIKVLRILHVVGGMGLGGAETMIMNYYRHINREKIQFDFVVHTNEEQMYDREILELGGKIYHTEKFNAKNYFSYRSWWKRFLKEHPEYMIVHGHIGSSAAVYLAEAKKQDRYTIAHSHGENAVTDNVLHRIVWHTCSYPTRFIADHFFACSEKAGSDRFGKRTVDSECFEVLTNAIDCDRFAFSEEKRKLIREQYGLNDALVVGHVGRFTPTKNHAKLIDIFECLHRSIPNSKLLLVGEGELENEMKNKCHRLGLDDAVVFAGVHSNADEYYSAMDALCFPSLREGLPVALVEAQASGLPCVISDTISEEADVVPKLVSRLSHSCGVEVWSDELAKHRVEDRLPYATAVREAGFDICSNAARLLAFYSNAGKRPR